MSDYDDLAYNLRKPLAPYFLSYAALLDLGRGTAFPTVGHDGAAVQAGARFFRTDIGFACYYDGTRWLTAHEYPIPIVPVTAYTAAGSPNATIAAQIRTDYAPYITRVATTLVVATTN